MMSETFEIDVNEFKRMLAFLFIICQIHEENGEFPAPEYILEKYVRYIKFPGVPDEYLWGLHKNLRTKFEAYCEKYELGVDNEMEDKLNGSI